MASETAKTLQIVAIQHELAMAIGQFLELDEMLKAFMESTLRRLNLRSFYLYTPPKTSLADARSIIMDAELCIKFPTVASRSETIQNDISTLRKKLAETQKPFASLEQHGLFFLGFKLPEIGFALLIRKQNPIENVIAQALVPIFNRLAVSAQYCIEHTKLREEVDARNSAEIALRHQAAHDVLTDLPNRKTMMDQLHQAFAAAKRHKHCGAVLFLDLDKFKWVNDSYGHTVGDCFLRAIAERLHDCARSDDIIARVGGDEFLIVAANLGQNIKHAMNTAQTIIEKLLQHLNQPIKVDTITIDVSFSIGIAMFPFDVADEGNDINHSCERLISFADAAMYRAKARGGSGFEFFSADMQKAADRRRSLEAKLRYAIENNEFQLFYQPIFSMDEQVIAAEALLRWHNEELGDVSPGEFIPVAETTQKILDLGQWVLENACKMIQEHDYLFAAGLHHISVNISARQLRQPDFVNDVLTLIYQYKIQPGRLQLEITETAAIDDIENTIEKMRILNEHSIHFSLDDFGTGYSSLSYLHRLPLNIIKIDQGFITGIAANSDNQVVVDAAIAMAHRLGIQCVAEGVETLTDVEYLHKQPIYGLQGFHYSRPLPLVEFKRFVATHKYRRITPISTEK